MPRESESFVTLEVRSITQDSTTLCRRQLVCAQVVYLLYILYILLGIHMVCDQIYLMFLVSYYNSQLMSCLKAYSIIVLNITSLF